jgi:hypothetical protein
MMVGRGLLAVSPVPSCPCVMSPHDHSSVDSSRVPARTIAATRSDIPTSDSSPRSLVPQLEDQKDSSHLGWRQHTSHIHVKLLKMYQQQNICTHNIKQTYPYKIQMQRRHNTFLTLKENVRQHYKILPKYLNRILHGYKMCLAGMKLKTKGEYTRGHSTVT